MAAAFSRERDNKCGPGLLLTIEDTQIANIVTGLLLKLSPLPRMQKGIWLLGKHKLVPVRLTANFFDHRSA